MIRSFKYRLYPSRSQERDLISWLHLNRELYNAALQERRDAWQKQVQRVSLYDQQKVLPDIREVRTEFEQIPIAVLRGTLRRLDKSFQNFFRRCKKGQTPGYPRFKGRDRFSSISIGDVKGEPIVAGGRRVAIPLLGKIKFKQHRPVNGRIRAIQIKIESDGHWYMIFACDRVEPKILPPTGKPVGIDLGLHTLVATSDGNLIENPHAARLARIRVERAQRGLSRRRKGSKRRRKAAHLLAKQHYQVAQIRRQHAIDVANRLVRNYSTICVEDLNIRGLARSTLSKSVNDAAWGILLHWIRVKAESAGREIVEIDPRGTSQICSGCGCEVRKTLADRIHNCTHCGLRLDRDVNAARNILALGLSARRAAAAVGAQL